MLTAFLDFVLAAFLDFVASVSLYFVMGLVVSVSLFVLPDGWWSSVWGFVVVSSSTNRTNIREPELARPLLQWHR